MVLYKYEFVLENNKIKYTHFYVFQILIKNLNFAYCLQTIYMTMKTLWILLFIAFALIICIKIAAYIHTIKYHKKQMEHFESLLFKTKHKQIALNQQLKVLLISEDNQKSNINALYTKLYKVVETIF